MKRKVIAILVIVIGIGIVITPFARTWIKDAQSAKLLNSLESGDAMVVDIEPVDKDDMDSWADSDGLSSFEYEDDFDEMMDEGFRASFTRSIADSDVEIGQDDGLMNPQDEQEADIGEIALGEQVEAVALDVEGLKKKRLVAIGKIEIGSIDLNLPIVEGAGKTELHWAVGHVVNTADFGRTGNCVLAGHRNYTYGSMLNRLGEVQVGDEVVITMRDGTIVRYEVYECLDVKPGVKEISNFHKDEERLTIVTCTPTGIATHRLLVRCHVKSIEAPSA